MVRRSKGLIAQLFFHHARWTWPGIMVAGFLRVLQQTNGGKKRGKRLRAGENKKTGRQFVYANVYVIGDGFGSVGRW